MKLTKKIGFRHGFSLAEMMIVMLILTIVLAASMPILSKRAKVKVAAQTGGITTANEGDTCVDGTDTIAYSKDISQLLVCEPNATLGDSCSKIGAKAVDITNMKNTDNPYVHLVCIDD